MRYILSLTEIHSPHVKQVYSEGETRVYENARAFPRAFFVTSVSPAANNQQAINFLFNSAVDLHTIAIVEAGESELPTQFSPGKVTIDSYTENSITLTARTDGKAFMVLTDTFYPTWKATVDGKPTVVYRTDYNFRGVVVPGGEHRIVFKDTLFNMTISIVIPDYNNGDLIAENLPLYIPILQTFAKAHKTSVQIIINDDGSTDGSWERLVKATEKKYELVDFTLLSNGRNIGFSTTVNRSVARARGEIVVLLNADVVPDKGFFWNLCLIIFQIEMCLP